MKVSASLSLILVLGMSSCVAPVITKRYERLTTNPEPPLNMVKLTAVATNPPKGKSSGPAVLQLSDHGQANYIEAIQKTSPGSFLKGVAEPFHSNPNLGQKTEPR